MTQFPGRIGVFEAVTISIPSSAVSVFGALPAYRVVYYLIPPLVAVMLLGA